MDELDKRLKTVFERHIKALDAIGDEVMSILHAHNLKAPTVAAVTVVAWLRGIYDMVEVGRGRPPHFAQPDQPDQENGQKNDRDSN
jgi:hypothetical protein